MRPIFPSSPTRRAATRLLLFAGTLAAGARVRAQAVNPDVNPYRTLEAQQVKPNVLILADSKGTLGLDMAGRTLPGTEAISAVYACVKSPACPAAAPYRWEYRYGPARIAVVKNVLGPYMTITDAPSEAPSACNASSTCSGVARPSAPIPPLHLIDDYASKMNIGLVTFDNSEGPSFVRNLVVPNTNAGAGVCETEQADFYMKPLSYPTVPTTQCNPPTPNSPPNGTIAPLDTQWSTPTYAALLYSKLLHNGVEIGADQTPAASICPSGSANIIPTFAYPAYLPAGGDPFQACGRKLFNFLLTDGQSSYCNNPPPPMAPEEVISYPACGAGGRNITPMSGSPMEAADTVYNGGVSTASNYSVRTFVLGISNSLTGFNSQQELRYDAYFGKTDASDPYGQGGIKLVQALDSSGNKLYQDAAKKIPLLYPADPYLRKSGVAGGAAAADGEYVLADSINTLRGSPNASSILCLTPGSGPRICSGTGFVCSHSYAYTATNQAQLAGALQSALSSVAAGDYTTEAPVIADNTPVTGGTKNIVYTSSADYPGYAGHLRAQDLDQPLPGGGFAVLWDAGDLLAQKDPATRRIYTYDAATKTTVKITGASTLPGITANGIDFLLGYDGTRTSTVRNWMLGDMTHSPPIAVMPPGAYLQGTTTGHDVFANTYANRTRLVLVGSSDGMVHAFNAATGAEEWAFVPPALLPSIERLYRNFRASYFPVGQPVFADFHIFGVTAPLNILDMDLNQGGVTQDWRTVVVGGLGPGGKAIFALDVTKDASTATPVTVLWYKGSADLTGLGNTWSSPSLTLGKNGTWLVSAGSGPDGANGNSGYTAGVTVYHLDPKDGALLGSYVLDVPGSDATALIRATTIAANTAYSTRNIAFADEISDRFYQTDTAGRIWDTNAASPSVGSWSPTRASYLASAANELKQPIYDSPAIGLYKDTYSPAPYADHFLQVMTWASGSFFERRPQVNDPNCSSTSCFSSNLYARICDLTASSAAGCSGSYATKQTAIQGLKYKIGTTATTYSKLARTLGSPTLFIPVVFNNSGSAVVMWPKAGDVGALYTLYDPAPTDLTNKPILSCRGESSVLFYYPFGQGSTAARDASGTYAASSHVIIDAGSGSASPAVVHNGRIYINMSSTTQAGAIDIGTAPTTTSAPTPRVASWREVF